MEQAQVLTFLNNKNRDLLLQFCGYSTTEHISEKNCMLTACSFSQEGVKS